LGSQTVTGVAAAGKLTGGVGALELGAAGVHAAPREIDAAPFIIEPESLLPLPSSRL
jgi:hypothetical protein